MVFDLRNAVRGKTLADAIRKGAPKWFSRYVARCFQVAYAKPKILCTDQAPPHVKSHFFAQWCDNNLPLDSDDDPALADFVLHLDCQDRHIFIVGEASKHADIEDIERAARRSAWSGTHIRVDNACVIPCVLAETWHNGAQQYADARGVPCLTVIRAAGEQGLDYEYLEFNLELHAAGAVEINDQLAQCGRPVRVRAARDDAAVAERIDSRETLREALRLLLNEHWYYSALKPDAQDAVMEKIGLQTVAAQQALHAAQWQTAYREAAHTLRAFMETSTS